MTAAELKHRLLRVVSVEIPGNAPSYVEDAVTNAVNHAYQVLWTDVPRERRAAYTRRIDEVSLVAGTDTYQLGSDVQAVLNPVRLKTDQRTVRAAETKYEVTNYGFISGSLTADSSNTRPEIYFTESIYQNADDAQRIRVIVAPTPATDETLEIEVEVQAPEFSTADFCAGSPPALRIPNDYVESILLPIAAYHLATQSNWFSNPDKLPAIEQEYGRALVRAGINPPPTIAVATGRSETDA